VTIPMRSLSMSLHVRLTVAALILAAGALSPAAAWGLPEGRVYEMVSPIYKGGHGVARIEAVAPDGESVGFWSAGTFAGAPSPGWDGPALYGVGYVARRSASGWASEPTMPPSALAPDIYQQLTASATLGTTVALGKSGPNWEIVQQNGLEEEVLLHAVGSPDTTADWEIDDQTFSGAEANIGAVDVGIAGASPELCHIIIRTQTGTPWLLPVAAGTLGSLYDLSRGCDGESPSLRLLGLNDQGRPLAASCAVREFLGSEQSGEGESSFNAVADGGREIFFTECGINQLYVRLNGERTLEVSRPLSPKCGQVLPCPGAGEHAPSQFLGASEDGSTVFFRTAAPLTGEGEPGAIYMAKIGCPGGENEACEVVKRQVTSLVQLSRDPHVGETAAVQGVVSIAPDGSRIYFVAHGVLSEASNAQGAVAAKGADNLYVYDGVSGRMTFVADLCSGPDLSGETEDSRCPPNLTADENQSGNPAIRNDTRLWVGQSSEAQTAGSDGRYLVFSTYGQLVANDTDTAQDVYRYDAETGVLARVSIGEGDYDANGNNDAFNASIAATQSYTERPTELFRMNDRAISEDGSRIVFRTAEPLSPAAGNGLENVYEWHAEEGTNGGRVSLISTGTASEGVDDVVIDPSGKNIFFLTSQGLVTQDTDGAPDIYDARLGGGFIPPQAPVQPCAGDGCQGPLTNPAPLLVSGSAVQAPGESVTPPATVVRSPKKKAHRKSSAKRQKPKRRAKRANRAKHADNEVATRGSGR
jgi:hypothetical protein